MKTDIKLQKEIKEQMVGYLSKINYAEFMQRSNRIEGEDRVNPGDIKAVEHTLKSKLKTLDDLLEVHAILGEHLQEDWVGKLRTVNVTVGGRECPDFRNVPAMMETYFKWSMKANSWAAHKVFERIHPFQDLNGRVGRLIWLAKAVEEGYTFKIPFLQAYYYQTLGNTSIEDSFWKLYNAS